MLGLARTNIVVLVSVSDTEVLKMQDVKILDTKRQDMKMHYVVTEQVLLICFEVKRAFNQYFGVYICLQCLHCWLGVSKSVWLVEN